jgi:hypothetical protein
VGICHYWLLYQGAEKESEKSRGIGENKI